VSSALRAEAELLEHAIAALHAHDDARARRLLGAHGPQAQPLEDAND
jgi:hypothetical protein